MGSEVELSGMETTMKEELCMEIDPPFKEGLATAEDCRKALDKVVHDVVILRTNACRAFDTQSAGASYATGFGVDKKQGIILTNRHVVKPGPVVTKAMFVNRKEIPVFPVYRDTALSYRQSVDRTVNLDVLTKFRVQCFSSKSVGGSSRKKKVNPEPLMKDDKEAFFVVRKGDLIGVYKSLSDCQAQVGTSVHDFGFFCYDPSVVQFMTYEKTPLAPE